MPAIFQDQPGVSHHDRFQSWRRRNPGGYVLAFAAKRRARLHNVDCSHFGDARWKSEDVGYSLTTKRKVCDLTPELLTEWAAREGVDVSSCNDCLHATASSPKKKAPAPAEVRPAPRTTTTSALTAFSWGYWGWGHTVERFLEAADALEASRGFEPPVFADVRLRRSVRAPAFNGNAFDQLVGSERYRWFNGLGNASIATGEEKIRIARPDDVEVLLDYVIEQAAHRRRVLFFCACQVVWDGRCHRHDVASLLLRAARKRAVDLTAVEWPGDEPEVRNLWLTEEQWRQVTPISVPLGPTLPTGGLAALPWGSIVRARSGDNSIAFLTGPAVFEGQWKLKIYEELDGDDSTLAAKALKFRDRYRCASRQA